MKRHERRAHEREAFTTSEADSAENHKQQSVFGDTAIEFSKQ